MAYLTEKEVSCEDNCTKNSNISVALLAKRLHTRYLLTTLVFPAQEKFGYAK